MNDLIGPSFLYLEVQIDPSINFDLNMYISAQTRHNT